MNAQTATPATVASIGGAMTVQEMIAQRDAWEAQIRAAIAEQRAGVIAEMKAKIAAFGLTAADLGLSAAPVATTHAPRASGSRKDRPAPGTGKVAPKYRSATGELWTGRGKRPAWVQAVIDAGGNIEDFRLSAEQQAAHVAANPPAPTVTPDAAPSPEALAAAVQATLDAASASANTPSDAAPQEPASTPEAAPEPVSAPSDAAPAAVDLTPPPNAKYADGRGNFWHGKFAQPQWVKDYLATGGTLDDLLIKREAA